MAKQDEIPGTLEKIQSEDVNYKSNLTSDLFNSYAALINGLCNALGNIKCEEIPFGTTSWSTPNDQLFAIAIGISGSGGGGGSAPYDGVPGINNATVYTGSNGGNGGNTTFNNLLVAAGGSGGRGFTYRGNYDTGGSGGTNSGGPVDPICQNRHTIKGLQPPLGGRGAYAQNLIPVNGENLALAGGLGGESGRIGILPIGPITGGTVYPVQIGAGGAAGANHPDTTLATNFFGHTLTNSQPGQNSPGMVIICFGGQ